MSETFTLEDAKWWFDKTKKIAVVGFSNTPGKAAHDIPKILIEEGFQLIPVNPRYEEILGLKSYKRLRDIPFKIDIVNVFRPSAELPQITEQAIRIGVKGVWAQLGIAHPAAKQLATAQNLRYVENKCFKVEYFRWKTRLKTA